MITLRSIRLLEAMFKMFTWIDKGEKNIGIQNLFYTVIELDSTESQREIWEELCNWWRPTGSKNFGTRGCGYEKTIKMEKGSFYFFLVDAVLIMERQLGLRFDPINEFCSLLVLRFFTISYPFFPQNLLYEPQNFSQIQNSVPPRKWMIIICEIVEENVNYFSIKTKGKKGRKSL